MFVGDFEQVVWTAYGQGYSFVFWVADVISIEKTGENFRLIYDVKGRFTVHRITNEEAKVSRSCLFFFCLFCKVGVILKVSLFFERLLL